MRTAAERIVERLRLPLNVTKAHCLRMLVEPLKVIENCIWGNYRAYADAVYGATPVSWVSLLDCGRKVMRGRRRGPGGCPQRTQ